MDSFFCGAIDDSSEVHYQLYESGVPQHYSDSLSMSATETPRTQLSQTEHLHSKSCTELLMHKHSDLLDRIRSDKLSPSQSCSVLRWSKTSATPTQRAHWNVKARQIGLDPGDLVRLIDQKAQNLCLVSPCNTAQQSLIPRSPQTFNSSEVESNDSTDSQSIESGSTIDGVLEELDSPSDKDLVIIDCRWPYEYEGGHIAGALNINDAKELYELFLKIPPTKKKVLVFYCEYSQIRGPRMSNFFKEAESALHDRAWFSDVYVLNGGYSRFFQNFPCYTTTRQYVSETDPRYEKQRKIFSNDGQYQMNIPAAKDLIFSI